MAEYAEVMRQFDRMCSNYQRKHGCPMECPMNGVNISQCRKIAFECPDSVERTVMSWAAEHPEPVYPRWVDWLYEQGLMTDVIDGNAGNFHYNRACEPIPADIAKKLGVKPKEGT